MEYKITYTLRSKMTGKQDVKVKVIISDGKLIYWTSDMRTTMTTFDAMKKDKLSVELTRGIITQLYPHNKSAIQIRRESLQQLALIKQRSRGELFIINFKEEKKYNGENPETLDDKIDDIDMSQVGVKK